MSDLPTNLPAPARRSRRIGYRTARQRQRKRPADLSLNLTPMIDTVFNLLFLFMIVSRFGAIEGLLPAPLPARASAQSVPAGEVPRTPIRIRLVSDPASAAGCTATVDRFAEAPVEVPQLVSLMQRISNEPGFGGDTPVNLVAGADVQWDHVVNAYNAALAAKYKRIYFAGGR